MVKILSGHERMKFLPQETHYFPLFWSMKDNLARFGDPQEFAALLAERLPAVNYGWTEAEDFLKELTGTISTLEHLPDNTAGLLRLTMRTWQDMHPESIRTGEKTPAHIYYAPKILKEFPACKFVLMCRDPRAAALSEWIKLKENPRMTRKFSAFNFIVRWSTAVALSKKLERSGKAIFVRYEDLITDPSETLGRVTAFLEMDMTADMLEVGVTNSSFSDKDQEGIQFNIGNLSRWKKDLDPAVIALIEHHLGSQMSAEGYAPSGIAADLSVYPLVRQKAKLAAARRLALLSPARFHHYNRNLKYRQQ
jgi:hypothetical protein